MLKSTGPKTDPWGTLLMLCVQVEASSLMTTLRLRPSNQLLIHQVVYPSNPFLSNLEIWMWWGTMSKALDYRKRRIYLICVLRARSYNFTQITWTSAHHPSRLAGYLHGINVQKYLL